MMAVRQRGPRGTVIHSDQGSQYGSDDWRRFCRTTHLEPSMSRRGNCWDNAVAESFFASLKKERIKKQIYKNRELASADVAAYIDSFYNPTRRHSHVGGVSPEAFEATRDHAGVVSTKSWELHSLNRPRSNASRALRHHCELRSNERFRFAANQWSFFQRQPHHVRVHQNGDERCVITFVDRSEHDGPDVENHRLFLRILPAELYCAFRPSPRLRKSIVRGREGIGTAPTGSDSHRERTFVISRSASVRTARSS